MAPKNNSEAESTMSSPHHMSLREQAAMRASAVQEDGQRYHYTPQTPIASPHPLANSVETPESLAHSARKEWRQHGSGITQELEEKRHAHTSFGGRSDAAPTDGGGTTVRPPIDNST